MRACFPALQAHIIEFVNNYRNAEFIPQPKGDINACLELAG